MIGWLRRTRRNGNDRAAILFLTPDLIGPFGGIAYHARTVLQALTESNWPAYAVALHDRKATVGVAGDTAQLAEYVPCSGHRLAFIAHSMVALRIRPRYVLVEHLHFAPLGWVLARLCGAQLGVVCHGVEAWTTLGGVRGAALRHADRILCVSHFTADRIVALNGVDAHKIQVVHNCLDRSAMPESQRSESDSPVLVTVGRLALGERYKGQDRVIRALARLHARFPTLTYDIVGEGDWRPDLEELAQREGVAGRVTFRGALSDEELDRLLSTATVYVMPSRGEGFGIAFLQAMIHGLPVIAGNADASPEVVTDGVTGYVVDPDDLDALVARLAELLSDERLRHDMGNQGREVVASRFSFETFRQALNDALPASVEAERAEGDPIRVLHVIPSLGPARGGPSFALPALARELEREGLTVEVCATDDNGPARLDVPHGISTRWHGITTWFFPRQTRFYTFSWPMTWWLLRHVRKYDLVHIHALFSYAAIPASLAARLSGVRYVVRPLGTLNVYGMTQRRPFLKRLSFRTIERPILHGAAAVQYTSEAEEDEARALGVDRPSAIIPPGVDLVEAVTLPPGDEFLDAYPHLRTRTIILFLSRLDPKKGLDLLIPAFSGVLATHPEAALVIAGDGEAAFVQQLHTAVDNAGTADAVTFTGFIEGRSKLAALAAASIYVLPSYSENFGIACVEALAAGLPVVVTRHVGIAPEVERYGAGLSVEAEVEPLRAALERLLSNDDARRLMATAAATLARERFSLRATGERTASLYRSLLGLPQRHRPGEPMEMEPLHPALQVRAGGGVE